MGLPPFAVTESDGSPKLYQPWEIIFPNGTLSDVGDGRVLVTVGTSIKVETEIYDARSPIIITTTSVLYLNTDGSTTTFLNGLGNFVTPIEARSPLLKNASVMSVLTDGSATNFLCGLGTYVSPIEARSPLLKNASIMSIQTDSTYILANSPLLKTGTVFHVLTDGTTTNYLRGDGSYRSVYECRSPLLSAGTVVSLLTDGVATNYYAGDGILRVPVEARSPLLKNASVMSILTSGIVGDYLCGIGSWTGLVMETAASLSLSRLGEFGLDTTDSVFAIHDGASTKVYAHPLYSVYFCFGTSANNWISEVIPITSARRNMAVTLSAVDVTVVGAQSPSLNFDIQERSFGSYNSAGIPITLNPMVASHSGSVITSLSNTGIAAQAGLFFVTSNASVVNSGTVNYIMGNIYYHMDIE